MNPKHILQQVWKYDKFISPQEDIINSVLAGRNTLALLPTGSGKSLCYQLPALMLDGITIVISPLMALIKDQLKELQSKGIKAIYLSSEQSYLGQINVFDYIREQNCKIVFIAPERLKNSVFKQSLKSLNISLIAVDEAHCISEWGNDFRPSYLHIKDFRKALDNPVTIALTATATPEIQKEIIEKLDLKEVQTFSTSFARYNLHIHTKDTENKFRELQYILQKHPGSSIIYVRTRKEAETLAQQLKGYHFNADFFHAGLSEKIKNTKQNQWMNDQLRILVATNAFGMGINKKEVRSVIHYSLPYSIENYYQEIGRAGRDGNPAYTYLIYNPFDISNTYAQFKSFYLSKKEFCTLLEKLFNRWQWAKGEIPEEPIEFNFLQFCSDYRFAKTKVQTLLQFLNNAGIIIWKPNVQLSSIKFNFSPNEIDEFKGFESRIFEALSRNISGIFQDHVKFNEKHWAKHLQVSSVQLNEYFRKWKANEWIEYHDGNLQEIRILEPREDRLFLGKLFKSFNNHQKQKLIKLKNLFFLVKNSKECRMQLLMRYFGEKNSEKCGICDICSETAREKNKGIEIPILEFIKTENKNLQQILSEFSAFSPNEIVDALQFLINEEKIKNLNFNTYIYNSSKN